MSDNVSPALPAVVHARRVAVMLDADVAAHFGVPTKRLNETVARNAVRFEGFAFRLTAEETADLRSQTAASSAWGGPRYLPHVYTEHGVVMAATVLRSDRAVAASRRIVEAFVAQKRTAVALPAAAGAVSDGLVARLRGHMDRMMQAEIDASGSTLRDETQAFIREGLDAIRARLQRSGLANEETEARILKTLAEAEEARARAATEREMTAKQRQRNLANALRLMIEAEMALAGGETAAFLAVLRDLGRD